MSNFRSHHYTRPKLGSCNCDSYHDTKYYVTICNRINIDLTKKNRKIKSQVEVIHISV